MRLLFVSITFVCMCMYCRQYIIVFLGLSVGLIDFAVNFYALQHVML